jgi:hypothetical protein
MPELIIPEKRKAEFFSRIGPPDPVTGCRLFLKKNGEPFESYGRFDCGEEYLAHRVAYIFYHGSIPAGMLICHTCDDPRCVAEEHLWVGTQADNIKDCSKKGRNGVWTHPENRPRGENHYSHTYPEKVPRGERAGKSKLNEKKVRSIRQLHVIGLSARKIAKLFSVSSVAVDCILNGRAWKHVV